MVEYIEGQCCAISASRFQTGMPALRLPVPYEERNYYEADFVIRKDFMFDSCSTNNGWNMSPLDLARWSQDLG